MANLLSRRLRLVLAFFLMLLVAVLAETTTGDIKVVDAAEIEEAGADSATRQGKEGKSKEGTEHTAGNNLSPPPPTCRRSVGKLSFNSVIPRRNSRITFCERFHSNTCCNRSHTELLRMDDLTMQLASVGEGCRKISATIACSSCQPHALLYFITSHLYFKNT